VLLALGWGILFGINYTYSDSFNLLFDGSGYIEHEIAAMGLYANLVGWAICCGSNWLMNNCPFSNQAIIFFFNIFGFLGCLYVQASSALPQAIFSNKYLVVIAIVFIRSGFSSFAALALMELNEFGHLILVSTIFFYFSNAIQLICNQFMIYFTISNSLALMSSISWVCIFIVHIVNLARSFSPSGAIKI
jgi:hypothetical protein